MADVCAPVSIVIAPFGDVEQKCANDKILCMKTLLLVSFFSISAFAMAKTDRPPLPAEIMNAKTVYLDNESGIAIVADYAYRELKKWNHFQISNTPDKADLVFVFTAMDGRTSTTGIVNGQLLTMSGGPCHASIDVRSAKGRDTSLWQDTKKCSWHGASADLVRELKKRMEAQ